jgi:DNA uptake protein ComE-like DNA-binding protein
MSFLHSRKTDNTKDFAFILLMLFTLAACFTCSINYFSNNVHSKSIVLDCRINPNDAQLGSLICLPKIGISKAQAIIKFRESEMSNGSQKPFGSLDDIEKVKGIGPKTAEALEGWLKFE